MHTSKFIFILAHQVHEKRFYSMYNELMKSQWFSYKKLKKLQEKKLQYIIKYSYSNIPYYNKLFKKLKLDPNDIKLLEDLKKLPILTKDIIKRNKKEFIPINIKNIKYTSVSTGGTSGTPFIYRLSKHDRFLSGAMLYRGWSYGGYSLGDKMTFLAGASLNVSNRNSLSTKLDEFARNLIKLSSFDMSENEMNSYLSIINKNKPKYLRGYASSIYFFSKWIEENAKEIHQFNAIFTTSEKLYPYMKNTIQSVLGCDVLDNYGLNDSGVSANECPDHNGYHIDTERSILEIVNNNNESINNGEGEIIGTSLYNIAMPFIRYKTGDLGYAIEDSCSCGRKSKLLKEITGRTVDILVTPEGKYIHGWFFLYILWEYSIGVKEYQVVQNNINEIIIKIVKDDSFDNDQILIIKNIIKKRSPNWNVKFEFVNNIERSKTGKFKFIINNMKNI